MPRDADGALMDQFLLELADLRSHTDLLLSRRNRSVLDPLVELRSDSSDLGNRVLSLMDEVQASFKTLRRKLEG